MRSMTFLVNDRSSGGQVPAVAVTITENSDGSLSFELKVIGPYTGDLRGFFFDIADESHIGKLIVAPTSSGFTEFRQGNDSIKDLDQGANMQGLLGSDGGYDAGIEIGTPGSNKDDYQSFSFKLTSSAGSLTLEDFSNVDFGLRLGSVGGGDRDGEVKLLEHTSSAIDAIDDANALYEDDVPNSVDGNVFANDLNLDLAHLVTAVNGSAGSVGQDVEGAYGTLRLNLNGSYTYTLTPAAQALAEGQSVTETFSYTAKSFDELTSFSTDSAVLKITVTGANDAPQIIAGTTSGAVSEDGSRHASGQLIALDVDQGAELDWSVTGSGPMTPQADYRYLLDNLNIARNGLPFFNDDFGSGGPPPTAPAFGYSTFGTFLESGGRLIMDSGLGAATNPTGQATVIAHLATLLTDTGPDASQGLKRSQDFTVEARYDLVIPAEARSNYVVRLSDPGSGNDIVEVGVRRMEDDTVAVALREVDTLNTVPVVREAIALEPSPGDNQIVLRLQHTANTNVVTASFDLLNGGVVTQTETFAFQATIFSNEDWTRAQVLGQAVATPQNGVYGGLSVQADGEWHYSLNNAAANVQALAQGEHVFDTFTVKVTDEHGASDTETVTVDVVGSNDAPFITGGLNFGFVAEDTPTQTASGQLFASDADHNAQLRWSAGPATVVPTGPSSSQFFGYSSEYHFTVDQFTIERNGATIFDDPFSDGFAPPSAPPFSNGTPASYQANGGYTESGDRLHLDGATGIVIRGVANPNLLAGQAAVLLTNSDPADLTRGLKSDDSFTVEARFDLAAPGAGQAYGIGLTDATFGGLPADQLGDSNISLLVRPGPGGGLIVQFNDFDSVADSATTLGSLPFSPRPDENQIVLRLIHDVDEPGLVHAEFDLLGGAGGPRTFELTGTGHIFGSGTPGYVGDDENWTRAQIVAFGPDPESTTFQGTYGSLSVDQFGNWTYTLDNDSPLVQALPGPLPPQPGQPPQILPQDVISVRVIDEHGLSSFRPVFINVAGTNDAPVATDDGTLEFPVAALSEDETLLINVLANDFDIDSGDTISVTGFFPGGYGAQITLNPDGTFLYDPTQSPQLQALNDGEMVVDGFTYIITDRTGDADTGFVSVRVHGVTDGGGNSAPDITGGTTTGLVYEDGARVAQGQLTATDPDPGSTLTWSMPFGPAFGFVEVDAFTGQWTYRLDNTRLDVQQLAQDEPRFDSFLVRVSDQHGAFDTGSEQLVTVEIRGADDRPFVNSPPAAPAVSEDGVLTASGQATAFDVDNGAQLTWSLSRGTVLGYRSNNHIEMDRFSILKNGALIFDDTFSDGLAPPSSPNPMVSYAANGFYTETNDRLIMDGAGSVGFTGVGFNGLVVGHTTLANTNTNPADTVLGLKSNHDFTIEGIFDLVVPDEGRETYGIQLTDALPSQQLALNLLGDDQVSLLVRKSPVDGQVYVQLLNSNSVTDTATFVDSVPLDPGAGNQILLRLSHDEATPGTITASFDYLSGEAPTDIGGVLAPTQIFGGDTPGFTADDENWTRAGFLTLSPDQYEHTTILAGTYGTLSIDSATGFWNYTLDNASPQVQALAQGENVTDSFHLRVTDQFGLSNSQQLNITVSGVNESGANSPPVANPDNNVHDPVVEAGAFVAGDSTATGNLILGSGFGGGQDTDPDGDTLRVVNVNGVPVLEGVGASVPLKYGSLHVNADGTWIYTLDDADLDTNALSQFAGQALEIAMYTVADEHGATSISALSIMISGSNDAPSVNPDSNMLTEDATPTVSGNVLDNDSDPDGDFLTVFAPPTIAGAYGTLTINPNGFYTYQVNAALVNFLDAGEVVHDVFDNDFFVGDAFTASTFSVLDIAIHGANEPPSTADAAVFEDGPRKASGEIDLTGASTWSILGQGPSSPWAEYRFRIDYLDIDRNGLDFFRDDFGGGGPPPQAQMQGFSYVTSGTFTETGGRANMDGTLAAATNPGFVGHFALLNTDTTADPTLGLKQNHAFTVEARFDLVLPAEELQTYGIRLTDAVMGIGNDIVELGVRRLAGDSFAVVLREINAEGAAPITLQQIPLTPAPGDNRIILRLEHAADSLDVTASFSLVNGDVEGTPVEFASLGHIFGNETWTRAQFLGVSPSQPQNGLYGTLELEPDGDWTYSLRNSLTGVQELAQGEAVMDTFTVQMNDGLGGSTTETVAIDVIGTNDFPSPVIGFNTFFNGPLPFTGTYVVEGSAPQTASGSVSGKQDVDHGLPVQWSVTANPTPPPAGQLAPAYRSDYLFKIDELKIIRDDPTNTADDLDPPFLVDGFNGSAPPSSAPTFSYVLAVGAFTSDGQHAVMDGQRAGSISGVGTPDLLAAHVAVLDTNIGASSPGRGLKSHHDFTVEARFELDFLPDTGESFGISLSDRASGELPPDQLGDDIVGLMVMRDGSGNLVVQFDERDSVADSITVLGVLPLLNHTPAPGSEIVLRLAHDTDDFGRVQASFDVLEGGLLVRSGEFDEALNLADRIFGAETPLNPYDDEVWTRVQIVASGRDTASQTAQGTYGSLSIADNGNWTYTLNNADPDTQNLAQGQIGLDSFNWRANDEYGASTIRTFNINVVGTSDVPPVNAVGSPGSDVLLGSQNADHLTGGAGSDLLIGLAGSDVFDYNSVGEGLDTITDFAPGVNGDILDFSKLLIGYVDGVSNPANFVQLQQFQTLNGPSTTVAVNADGIDFDFVSMATLQSVGGLSFEDFSAHNLLL